MKLRNQTRQHSPALPYLMGTLIVAALNLTAVELVSGERMKELTLGPAPTAQAPVATKPLPPRDCWRCTGPAVCGPCRPHHAGFLYYGTYPWDDDPVNGFSDCPSGNCGHVGIGLSLHWIHFRQAGPRLSPARHRPGGDIGSYQHPR